MFEFPKIPLVTASSQSADIDYGARTHYVKTKRGLKGIRHGAGPFWSFGQPSDLDVWRSVGYEESTFDAAGTTIVDARGQLSNGNQWRYLGKFGESASYSDADRATARILDQVLDGACLQAPPR